MPIVLPETLPATEALRAEGVAVLAPVQAPARVLEIGLINLMPDKPTTETQLARLLGAAPHFSRLHLFWPVGQNSRRTPAEHLDFYDPLEKAASRQLDALIVTGAPVEQKPYGEVRFWPELAALYDHARAAGLPTLNICWAAMAALHHYRGVAKRNLQAKAFGVFDQTLLDAAHPLMQGMPRSFPVPVSRHAHVPQKAIAGAGVAVLAASSETGVAAAYDAQNDTTLLFDHFEYDAGTLLAEFLRDRQAALPTAPPSGLALGSAAAVPWRPAAHLLFRNWLADVERKAQARRPGDLLGWLLTRSPAAEAGTELLVQAGARRDLVAGITATATGLGATIISLRTWREGDGVAVHVTFDAAIEDAVLEQLTKQLQALDGVAKLMHRTAPVRGAAHVATELDRAA